MKCQRNKNTGIKSLIQLYYQTTSPYFKTLRCFKSFLKLLGKPCLNSEKNASYLNETSFKSCCVYVQYKKMSGLKKHQMARIMQLSGLKYLKYQNNCKLFRLLAPHSTQTHMFIGFLRSRIHTFNILSFPKESI